LIYTDIFKEYQKLFEKLLYELLKKKISNFNKNDFENELANKHDNICDEYLMDTLLAPTDFDAFKEMMLEHKKVDKI